MIEASFEKSFIFDSYANRIGKGSLKAILRFDFFSRKVSHNFTREAYILKADIRHYFETVNHKILLNILIKRISEPKIIWLIKKILNNYSKYKGMPLGNLTSQFFANVYLNELDQFIKHQLKAKYYLRYVDDFVILHESFSTLENWKERISSFLAESLSLKLHPDKSNIIQMSRGIDFLGFKIFRHHKLMRKRNQRKFQKKLREDVSLFENKQIDYDQFYNFMEGWIAYAKFADTYKLRKKISTEFEQKYPSEISIKEVNRGLTNKFNRKETIRL